jgi:O-antigen/teichoic acid export membrane protein
MAHEMTPAAEKHDAADPAEAGMTPLRRVAQRLLRGDFIRGAFTIVAGTGVAQLLVVLSSPVLTHLYSPSDYGVYSIATSVLILASITCLQYEFAIPLPKDDVTAANLLGLSLVVNVGMSLATAIGLILLGPWLFGLFGAAALGPYVLLLALIQFGSGIVSALLKWAIRTKNFSEIALNRIVGSVSLVGLQVGLGALGVGVLGLMIGVAAGSVAGAGRLARAAWRSDAAAFRRISWKGMAAVAKRYRRFPIFSSGSTLLAYLGVRAPLLALIAAFGTEVGGEYALAERVLYLPLTLIAGSVGQVFTAEVARLANDQPEELRRSFRRTTVSLALTALLPAIAIAVLAPMLAGLVFGAAWTLAGSMVALLVPMFYLAFVFTSTGDVLYVLERQGLHLVREGLRIVILAGSIPVAAALQLPPLSAVAFLSAAGCLTYVLYGLISWYAVVNARPMRETAEDRAAGYHRPGTDGLID